MPSFSVAVNSVGSRPAALNTSSDLVRVGALLGDDSDDFGLRVGLLEQAAANLVEV